MGNSSRILRGLGSRLLSCGCLVGLYETYDGQTVAILDARDPRCVDIEHRVDMTVDLHNSSDSTSQPAEERGAGRS